VRDQLPLFAPPAEAPVGDGAARVKLVVAYDGRDFAGVAPNVGVRTVGGTLGAALERVLRHPVELTVAGRTDAGVHASGQVVSFDARAEGLDLPKVQRAVNRMLRPAIVVRSAEVAPPDFDARFSARARRYRYLVLNRPTPDPFLAATAWHVETPLALPAMRLACDPLIGEHDFSSFCRRPKGDPAPLVRRVLDARWSDQGDGLLRFDIGATAFCHQMVRSIVGTMVDVGRGRRRAGEVKGILAARDRSAAGEPAPPHGLCLDEVVYG
jgi:tRNA pseudouridine38-40 synthase